MEMDLRTRRLRQSFIGLARLSTRFPRAPKMWMPGTMPWPQQIALHTAEASSSRCRYLYPDGSALFARMTMPTTITINASTPAAILVWALARCAWVARACRADNSRSSALIIDPIVMTS